MKAKERYEKPGITGEQVFETRAMACAKVPGLGDPDFCGTVWIGANGSKPGCTMNPNSRSS